VNEEHKISTQRNSGRYPRRRNHNRYRSDGWYRIAKHAAYLDALVSILPRRHHQATQVSDGDHQQLAQSPNLQWVMTGQGEENLSAVLEVPEASASGGEGRNIYST
jgi:hypothetical protein